MANIDFAALSGNARVSAVLHQMIQVKLADKASLWRHPAITYYGNLSGSGSSALQVPIVGLGGTDVMAAVSDGSRDRKSTRLNSSHVSESRMPSSA